MTLPVSMGSWRTSTQSQLGCGTGSLVDHNEVDKTTLCVRHRQPALSQCGKESVHIRQQLRWPPRVQTCSPSLSNSWIW